MIIYPVRPLTPEWMSLATETEHIGSRDGMEIDAYHFDVDPDSGLPFRTVVIVASYLVTDGSDGSGVGQLCGTNSVAARLWGWSWIKPSAVKKAISRCEAELERNQRRA